MTPISFDIIASKIAAAAALAKDTPSHPEAKLRELVAPLWDEYIRVNKINLHFQPRDERSLANGRADTVYNRLILEYKKPGVIKPDNAKNRQLISQVKGYIEDLAKEERWKEERLLGVTLDGFHFHYIRKVGRWIEEEPVKVSAESVEFFLLNLEKLTSKAALVPDNLIKDFAIGSGARNYIASNMIKAFYAALTTNVNEKVKVFFEQWAMQFAEVHGAIENKKFDAQMLFDSYGFKKQEQKDFKFLAFFFALDTYYAVLMKLLAYQVVGYYTLKNMAGLPLSDWESLSSDALKDKLSKLEEGGIFRDLGIRNFLEGDLLSWYLNDWNNDIDKAIRAVIERLNQYDPETMELVTDETRDILKRLYQFLVPQVIRHDLGEYYTPDWLAERCLNQVGYGPKDPLLLKKRLLDPGCGSGTFLILAIKRAKEHARMKGTSPAELLTAITKNIVGFDLNPLAVISARTNYLLAVAELLKHKKGEITIPVYLCDSINPPSAREQRDLLDPEAGQYLVNTSVGVFVFPDILVKREMVQKVTELLEDCVRKHLPTEGFLSQVVSVQHLDDSEKARLSALLGNTYEKLVELDRKGINGVWARILKNAFAPLFVGRFDLVVGNPPWVNWEDLPQSYRDHTRVLWQQYGLFSLSGHEARLGGGKKDISMLMVYVSIDRYLKDKGKLCVVITQTLFKTQGAGDGFRRFRLGQKGQYFRVDQLDDMVDLQPFEGATNRTSVLACSKGDKTIYPVPYLLWKKKAKGRIVMDYTFTEVSEATVRFSLRAQPVSENETGPWSAARPKALAAASKIIGHSDYQARAGACTWMNGVYLGEILSSGPGDVIFANLFDEGKITVRSVQVTIEKTLLFPLLRGRNILRWQATPANYILATQDPHTRKGYDLDWMRREVPLTLEYLQTFESELLGRSGYKKYLEGETFYSLYNVGTYTFAPWKVAWTRVGTEIKSAVITPVEDVHLGGKSVVPIETVVFVAFGDRSSAHYFCALLNSTPSRFVISSYSNKSSGSFGSPHILSNVRIPQFDGQNVAHCRLSELSQLCHEKTAVGIQVDDLEEQIDNVSAEIWGLTKEELADIRNSLEELQC